METPATILLNAFYASVEQLLDPSLWGKPIAVGSGVVLAASYEAKAFGVHGGMSGRKARELCPQLVFVGGHFSDYQRLGDAAVAILDDFTPLVERILQGLGQAVQLSGEDNTHLKLPRQGGPARFLSAPGERAGS